MLSALIHSRYSGIAVRRYPAMPLVEQLVHERYVLPGPLVLGKSILKYLPVTKTETNAPGG